MYFSAQSFFKEYCVVNLLCSLTASEGYKEYGKDYLSRLMKCKLHFDPMIEKVFVSLKKIYFTSTLLPIEQSMLLRINFANEFSVCVMDTFGCFRLVVFKKMKGKHDMLLV